MPTCMSRPRLRLLLIVAALGVTGVMAEDATADQAPAAILRMHADAAAVAVGEEVTVHLDLRWPAAWGPQEDANPTVAFRAVQDIGTVARRRVGDEERRRWTVRLLAPRSGAWSLPRPSVTLDGPDGPVTVQANEVILQIGTGAAEPDLAPPRPLYRRPPHLERDPGWPWWAYAGLVAGLLAAATIGAIVFGRRRRPPPLTPYQRFLRDLPAIRPEDDGRQTGAALSVALRRYCGAIWHFDGVGATHREVLAHVPDELSVERLQTLRRIVAQLEELRWAPDALPVSALTPLRDAGREWVQAMEADRAAAAAAREEAA